MKKDLLKKLEWDIRMEPVLMNGGIDTGRKAIIRNDNSKLLSVVGKKYEPVTNHQIMQFTEALTKSGEFELKGFDELNDGKVILAFLKNTNPHLKINGCANEEYMFVGNSFDGTKRLHIGTASNLIRCQNQFSSTLKVFTKKHTSFIDMNQFIAKEIIKGYKEKKMIIYESFNGMDTIRVDESIIEKLMKEVYAMLSNESKSSKENDWRKSQSMQTLRNSIDHEMNDLGNNAFGLFNGVTHYTTHAMRSKDIVSSQISGTANLINQKAFRFCNNLKKNFD